MTTPRVTVPVEPTAEMLEAGILAAWPGPEIVYADEHAGPEFMLAAAFKAMLSARGEVDRPVWFEGAPSQHHAKEWFIAETIFGDRVVLTALPEEYTYDFKTADETYIKADRIKRWMPFPDSEYLPPSPAPAPEGGAVSIWSDARNVFVRYAEAFTKAERYEKASAIADKVAREIEALATREEAPASHHERNLSMTNDELIEQALSHPPLEAPAEAGEWTVERTASGETVLGFKVAAWQYLGPNDDGDAKYGHRYCEHWSTVGNHPKKVVRLFTEDQLRSALRAQPPAREDAQPVSVCDGVEQPAFEEWAAKQGFDMHEHPLHYLFLDAKTDAARRAWKAGLEHAVGRMSTHPAPDALRGAVEQTPGKAWIDCVQKMLDRFDRAKGKGGYPTANEREAMRRCMIPVHLLASLQSEQKGGA